MKLHQIASLALVASGCVFSPKPKHPEANYAPAVKVGDRIEVTDQRGHYASLVLEAQWVAQGDRHCVRDAEVGLVTAAGTITLYRTTACVTMSPFSLVGEADVPFPALGYLSRVGVEGNAPRAKIALGLGRQLGSIEVAGDAMRLNPHQFYLSVDYFSGLSASLGKVSLSTPSVGAKLVIAPQEPMVYLAGSLTGVIEDAGLGFSVDGRLPLSPRLALYDGRGWKKQRITGHILAHGTIPIHPYPLSVHGRVLLDLDADDDGSTIFDGDADDLSIAADGTLSFGYDKAGFGFSVEMAKASVIYDGKRKQATFASEAGGSLFEATPLAFIDAGSKTTVRGFYRTPNDFEVTATMRRSMFAGFAVADTTVTLSSRGVVARGTAVLPGIGRVAVEGSLAANGHFSLRGRGDLTLAGFNMVAADVTLGTRGVRIAGTVNLPGIGTAKVVGSVMADGRFVAEGRGNLAPAGLRLADAKVVLKPAGAMIGGGAHFLGNHIKVSGSVAANGRFDLSGQINLHVLLLRGTLKLSVSNRGVRGLVDGRACIGKACVPLAGMEVDTRGRVCPIFPVIGKQCIKLG